MGCRYSLKKKLLGKANQKIVINFIDKKENEVFLIDKEIQMGSVAKSFMRKGFLIYEEMRKYLTIYEEAVSHTVFDFATDPFRISLFMRKIRFSFLSVF